LIVVLGYAVRKHIGNNQERGVFVSAFPTEFVTLLMCHLASSLWSVNFLRAAFVSCFWRANVTSLFVFCVSRAAEIIINDCSNTQINIENKFPVAVSLSEITAHAYQKKHTMARAYRRRQTRPTNLSVFIYVHFYFTKLLDGRLKDLSLFVCSCEWKNMHFIWPLCC
jgi:hypothetical protein